MSKFVLAGVSTLAALTLSVSSSFAGGPATVTPPQVLSLKGDGVLVGSGQLMVTTPAHQLEVLTPAVAVLIIEMNVTVETTPAIVEMN